MMKLYDVLAIGELNVDMIVTGLKSLPALGREIIAQDCHVVMGSSTAICASGIARLGLKTGFIGKVGNDPFGKIVINELKQNGVDTQFVMTDNQVKTGITISLSMEKDRALVTSLGSINALSVEEINLSIVEKARHIHVGSFFLQSTLRNKLANLFSTAKEKGLTTSLDSGWDDTGNWDYDIRKVLRHTDIFFPNEIEAKHISGRDNTEEALAELSKYCSNVVIKKGPKGAVGKFGNLVLESTAFDELKPVDTTGAGDSFNAGFIYGFLKGYDMPECMLYGNACGSISVTRIGGASSCPGIEEVENLIAGRG